MEDYHLGGSIAKADGRNSIRLLRQAELIRAKDGRRPDQINPFDALRDQQAQLQAAFRRGPFGQNKLRAFRSGDCSVAVSGIGLSPPLGKNARAGGAASVQRRLYTCPRPDPSQCYRDRLE